MRELTSTAILASALAAVADGSSVAVATVVATDRSVPRHPGTRMVVHADGRQLGTIGGGELEARVVAVAQESLRSGAPRLVTFDLVDPGEGDPGVCGGTVTIYVEPLMPERNVVVIGCGHVGKAVVELAHWLGFHVTAIDDRAELASSEQLPLADEVLSGSLVECVAKAPITSRTHVVLVTRNMAVDLEVLPVVLATPAESVGVLGSARRWAMTRDRLVAGGVDEGWLDRVRSPVGLDIAAETPEQIATSILAEIISLG